MKMSLMLLLLAAIAASAHLFAPRKRREIGPRH
jgi:hypothetical protein